uniref:Uncharacterized protein n=1 Tax=Leersia perrieri TaxID=77586 RepID=A0A0D9XZQ6_9ORYZ
MIYWFNVNFIQILIGQLISQFMFSSMNGLWQGVRTYVYKCVKFVFKKTAVQFISVK